MASSSSSSTSPASSPAYPELIPALPEELAQECLLRVSYKFYPHLRHVCRRWKTLLANSGFHNERRVAGLTEHCVCFIQALPPESQAQAQVCVDGGGDGVARGDGVRHPSYGVSVYDAREGTWEWLPALPDFPGGLPLFCQCVAVGERLVLLGGWDPASWRALRCVYVFDFPLWRWRRGADMPGSPRSLFAAAVLRGRVLVAGGHDDGKNALSSALAYHPDLDFWSLLPDMSCPRDECKAAVLGDRCYVVSGYPTESQGEFSTSVDVLNPNTNSWTLIDNMWPQSICPHVLITYNNALYALQGSDWTVYDPETNRWKPLCSVPQGVKTAPCATVLGDSIFHPAAEHGSLYEPFSVRPNQENGLSRRRHWSKVYTLDSFKGIAQSACTVEI